MVKPSRAMQPEAVNLKKAGRDTSKAFGEDSFRNYMARKISLQRQQFGLVLPPAPADPRPLNAQDAHIQSKAIGSVGDTNEQPSSSTGQLSLAANGGTYNSDDDASPNAARSTKRRRFGLVSSVPMRSKKKLGEEIFIEPLLLKSASGRPRLDDNLALRQSSPKSSPTAAAAAASRGLLTSALTGQESPSQGASRPDASTPECQMVASPDAMKIRSDLFFLGTVVLINGFTNPDAETLQRLLHKHGGDVEKYETNRVTHIIAEQLSTAKAKVYQKQRNPKPVCVPGWIMDSIKQGKKLPCAAYLLDEVRKESMAATKSVSSFYTKKQTVTYNSPATASVQPPSTTSREITERPKPLESPQSNRLINGRIRTVGTDPNFLESFFAASRLSFIGSYKQRTGHSPTKTPMACENTSRYVFHVDMDCFFASVVLRNFPEYRDKPVAISHHGMRKNEITTNRNVPTNSSSECATCNYVARQFGIEKGMYLGRAKELCPELIVLQYDFDGYEEVSEAVHEILLRHSAQYNGYVEQVSCDESYIEMFLPKDADSCSSKQAATLLAEAIRNEIFEATQCTATVGVASNKLLSKLATDFAKPNKSYLVENPRTLLSGLDLHQLPGVGYHLRRKLQEYSFVSVTDVWKQGLTAEKELCDIVGNLTGKKLYGYCHGIDNRELQPSLRKTIGAECSYGVRFDGPHGPDHMIRGLCEEVEKRMRNVRVRCKKITIKIKQRKPEAPPPPKFLGHGSCYNHSKSGSLPGPATRAAKDLFATAMDLFNAMNILADDIRGMGIVASTLVHDHGMVVEPVGENAKISILFDAHRKRVALDESSIPTKAKDRPCDRTFESDCQSSDIPQRKSLPEQRHVEEQAFILPSLSQIHMSQVDELPSLMRKQILSQMGCARKTAARQTGPPSFRQTHVRKLFRLAEVKSRPGDVSLTQLGCLPLELQLQIANEDGMFATPTTHEVSNTKRYNIGPSCSTELEEVNVVHIDPRQDDEFDRLMSKPFAEFMDEHSATDDENVRQVADFFCICISEGRLVDAVVLLRQLRTRADAWNSVYNRIYEVVDEKVEQCTGNRLDRPWVDL